MNTLVYVFFHKFNHCESWRFFFLTQAWHKIFSRFLFNKFRKINFNIIFMKIRYVVYIIISELYVVNFYVQNTINRIFFYNELNYIMSNGIHFRQCKKNCQKKNFFFKQNNAIYKKLVSYMQKEKLKICLLWISAHYRCYENKKQLEKQ